MKDEDEEDDSHLQPTKYPVMPSRMALQVMKNRLVLALLGKKLMKWTVLATGKELRRLAADLMEVDEGYDKQTGVAFIALARCRYFYPNMNQTVLENVPAVPRVTVADTPKSIAGVKVHTVVTEIKRHDPYPFLGMGTGGEAIHEAKKAWLDLLKKTVQIAAIKKMFILVETAHKSAKKKYKKIEEYIQRHEKLNNEKNEKRFENKVENISVEEVDRIISIEVIAKDN